MSKFAKDKSRAVVIGASIAGLLAAKVLSKHFSEVVLLENDPVVDEPHIRKGQAQGLHTHVLLAKGCELISEYFPKLAPALAEKGVTPADLAKDLRWFVDNRFRKQFTSQIPVLFVSRACLEFLMRQELLELESVCLRDRTKVVGVEVDPVSHGIEAVRVEERGTGSENHIQTDFVVDASGRSHVTKCLLQQYGYNTPKERVVEVNIGYSTRVFQSETQIEEALMISPCPPEQLSLCTVFPIESKQVMVGLAGWGRNYPPSTEEGFTKFLSTLPIGDACSKVSQLEAISPVMTYRFPASVMKHYEKLRFQPSKLITFGDALCSVNPVYGQGMTIAALHAEVLDSLLVTGDSLEKIHQKFYHRAARVNKIPWKLATTEDFRFSTTSGDKAWDTKLLNLGMRKIHAATCTSQSVCRAFLRAANLLEPPVSLLDPRLLISILMTKTCHKTGSLPST